MIDANTSLITPGQFKLPKLTEQVFLFFMKHHFLMFHTLVSGGKIGSYGPVQRFSFTHKSVECSALGGFIGAPLAVIIAENALVSGGKMFKSFGTAGYIGSGAVEIGDIHRPATGCDETGMIRDYGGQSALTSFNYQGLQPTCNGVVSVNSFYRLMPANLARYRQQKIDIIDMEAAPLNFVITGKGASFQPLFVISDKIAPDLSWHYENRSERLKAGLEQGLSQLL